MDELVVSTVVYRPRNEVYDFLIRFPQYAAYSDHLREVLTRSESEETEESNTRYGLKFAWWKLTYTVESEVTDTNRPHTIDWRIVENLNAHGRWRLTKIEDDSFPLTAPDAADVATRVTFEGVIDRLEPAIRNEAKETVERVVADLEGRTRPVELTVEHHST